MRVLLTGATGFVGRALLPALVNAGHHVRATTRDARRARASSGSDVDWTVADVSRTDDLRRSLDGMEAAYFLVHAMGAGNRDYAAEERRSAESFRDAAASAGVRRIVYLGGVAPSGPASEHLKSRLDVGTILRSGTVPALELRASMIIGNGSASWQIVRDLSLRLPAMLLPAWTSSRTSPIALDDVVVALVRGLEVPLPASAVYDIPGPAVLSAREILLTIAALRGRHVPSIHVPFLSVSLSSWWLKLVTRADFSLSRELVLGLTGDLLPDDDRYWKEIGYRPQWTFEAAAHRALTEETRARTALAVAGALEEAVVQLVGPKLPRGPLSGVG